MRTLYLYILFFFFLMQLTLLHAQNVISLEDAYSIALKNNYNILTARNSAESAKINNTPGNAGMLPTAQVSGGAAYELNNVYQKYSSGTIDKYPAMSTVIANAGVELSWTVYDGGKMYVTRDKLNEIESLGELQFKAKVMETIYQVTANYYDIVRQKQQLKSINEVINYNNERVIIAQTGFNAGTIAKNELLQAKIDLNAALSNAVSQQNTIEAAQKSLNSVLGQNLNEQFEVSDSIPDVNLPDKNELIKKTNSSNINLLVLQKQIKIADLALQETQTLNSPKVSLKGVFEFSQTINSDGSLTNNRNIGPQISAAVQIPIYTAGETDRKTELAKLEMHSAELDLKDAAFQLDIDIQNIFTNFETQQKLLKIEKENNDLTKENLNICLDRLKYGQTTSLEIHLAQDLYMQSCTKLVNIQYSLKTAETKLKQLAAEL
jgi:outer membrane protein